MSQVEVSSAELLVYYGQECAKRQKLEAMCSGYSETIQQLLSQLREKDAEIAKLSGDEGDEPVAVPDETQ